MFKSMTPPALVLVAVGLTACSAPTSSNTLSVTLTAAPDPTSAVPSQGVTYQVTNPDSTVSTYEYQYQTTFTVNMQETGGNALTVTAVNLVVQQASGGIVITPSGGDNVYYRFNSSAGTNSLPAHGTAAMSFVVWYTLPSKGKEALATVTLSFSDANSNSYSQSVAEKIAP
jgi:hypothetical protein